jgi:hypothetical protein
VLLFLGVDLLCFFCGALTDVWPSCRIFAALRGAIVMIARMEVDLEAVVSPVLRLSLGAVLRLGSMRLLRGVRVLFTACGARTCAESRAAAFATAAATDLFAASGCVEALAVGGACMILMHVFPVGRCTRLAFALVAVLLFGVRAYHIIVGSCGPASTRNEELVTVLFSKVHAAVACVLILCSAILRWALCPLISPPRVRCIYSWGTTAEPRATGGGAVLGAQAQKRMFLQLVAVLFSRAHAAVACVLIRCSAVFRLWLRGFVLCAGVPRQVCYLVWGICSCHHLATTCSASHFARLLHTISVCFLVTVVAGLAAAQAALCWCVHRCPTLVSGVFGLRSHRVYGHVTSLKYHIIVGRSLCIATAVALCT